jgi:hypothetical protein
MKLGPHPARQLLIGASLLCGLITSALAQLSVGIALPGVSIGIDLPVYPQMVRVPGYPVYYAPQMASNYFFYDGVYWVYQGDNWYASTWYNGPWKMVGPMNVPPYVLRIPVGYYRMPPAYFRGARADAPPPWDRHWGRDWQQHRKGWNQWNPRQAPAPAPLPVYQRQYSGDRYPNQAQRQQSLSDQHYRYPPREPAARAQQPPAGHDQRIEASERKSKPDKDHGRDEDRNAHRKQP